MKDLAWWNSFNTIIQYNLQIQDTAGMIPEEMAEHLEECNADAVVINVGGIYAWYQSKIPYHHINEFLPKDLSFLEELIDCCHRRNIRVIGRFDFSKVDDYVYLEHPEWFVKDQEGNTLIFGSKRMGNWSLLLSTCINSGFRNEEFAVKVLEEAITNFDLDGIFFNAPQMENCFCESCRRKYRRLYQEELPENIALWKSDWKIKCSNKNYKTLYDAIKQVRKDIPVIFYYGTYRADGSGIPENLYERYESADMICTEAQDILSAGKKNLPYKWKPTLNMKLGQYLDNYPKPFGIIHSCPGMDWRHTGLPAAEYEFWMSQIPASAGQLWHSLTGYEKTITDRRMLKTMMGVNQKIALMKPYMQNAESIADVLLLWQGGISELGFVDALMNTQISYDVMGMEGITLEKLKRYPVVILPNRLPLNDTRKEIFTNYVQEGGNLLIEKTDVLDIKEYASLLGISQFPETGKNLLACYGQWEDKGSTIKIGLADTNYFPLKDDVLYAKPNPATETLMTFVPPFAPQDGVGAPPERASIPVKHTDIPMITRNKIGKGSVLGVYFSISQMNLKYGLEDHRLLFRNCINDLLKQEQLMITDEVPEGIYVYLYRTNDTILLHLVNAIGERPLRSRINVNNLRLRLKADLLKKITRVKSVLEETDIQWMIEGSYITICIDQLKVWDMILIE